jgi:hypothetical protein
MPTIYKVGKVLASRNHDKGFYRGKKWGKLTFDQCLEKRKN